MQIMVFRGSVEYDLDDSIERLKKFDNSLKSLKDRSEYIESLLEDSQYMINDYIENNMLKGEARIEERPINITIGQMATYLLRSEEVESSRKGAYSFYETEQDYRKVKIGKASIATDISSRDDISKEHFDKYKHDECLVESVYELFNFDNMTPDDKKKLIKIGLKEKDNTHSSLREVMQSAYDYIMDMLTDDKDKEIVDMLIEDRTESEIAKIIGIAQPNVNKRIKRICENKI